MQFIKLKYLIIAISFSSAMYGQNFYVSKKGNDKNNGSITSPVASLTAAQKLVRNYKAKIRVNPNDGKLQLSMMQTQLTRPHFN